MPTENEEEDEEDEDAATECALRAAEKAHWAAIEAFNEDGSKTRAERRLGGAVALAGVGPRRQR